MRTDTEEWILLAVLRLGDGAYPVAIQQEIRERTKMNVSPGTLYTVLDRLEGDGYLDSSFGDPTPERGGKAKRYFRIKPAGLRALRHSRDISRAMWRGLGPLIEKP